jgi:hypothetical protein
MLFLSLFSILPSHLKEKIMSEGLVGSHFIGVAIYHGAMLFTLFGVSLYFFLSKKL